MVNVMPIKNGDNKAAIVPAYAHVYFSGLCLSLWVAEVRVEVPDLPSADNWEPQLQDGYVVQRQRALNEPAYHTVARARDMIYSNVVLADWLTRHTVTWLRASARKALVDCEIWHLDPIDG